MEVIEFSKKTAAKQAEISALLNGFIQQAVIDIPQENIMIVDAPSGSAIACSGPLEDALEDALFISINIRDEILKHNAYSPTPLYVQFGVHLGDAREVKNAMVGEGVEEANRIMSFAYPNQILVSNVYFEMASKLTQEIAQMFEKYDMHAHEHDIYAVRMLKEAATETAPTVPADIADVETGQTIANKINWKYVGLGVLALTGFFVLGKLVTSPTQPTITMEPPVVAEMPIEKPIEKIQAAEPVASPVAEPVAAVEPVENIPAEVSKKAKIVRKKPTPKPVEKSIEKPAEKVETPTKSAENPADKPATAEKSSWETVKESVANGTERKCSQAEIAMNQCNK